MSLYLSTLDEQLEKLDSIIEELSNTYGGEKYLGRLREIADEMDKELRGKTYTIKGYRNGVLMAEECSVEESEVQEVVDELESEGYVTEVEES